MEDGTRKQVPDILMQDYGRRFRENKMACEAIFNRCTPTKPITASDLEWLQRHCWKEAQRAEEERNRAA